MFKRLTHYFARIKTFGVLWFSGLAAAFVLMSAALILSTSMLHDMSRRFFIGGRSLEADHLFELEILSQRREDLLWRLSGEASHRENRDRALQEADRLVGNLRFDVTSATEMDIVAEIERMYLEFRYDALSEPAMDPEVLAISVGQLLDAVHRHRAINNKQMYETLSASDRLNNVTDAFSLAVVFLMAVALGGGALALWSRIFRPAVLLAQAAAAFGRGNLQARAPVLRNDEMGALNRTFNSMADAVCIREKERRALVAVVVHDIRSPLNNVSMAAQMLNKLDLTDQKQRALLSTSLFRNIRRMQNTLDDLTDSAQSEAGQIVLDKKEFDLSALTRELVREQKELSKDHKIRFEGEERCSIWGDRNRLERVVMNLLSNAIKYSPAGSEVAVKLETRDKTAILSIQDQGVGIAKEDLERIFLPFTRLDRTRSMAHGTGIGLTSVKNIVAAHLGNIQVTSEPEVGTRVEVSLPLETAKATGLLAKVAVCD